MDRIVSPSGGPGDEAGRRGARRRAHRASQGWCQASGTTSSARVGQHVGGSAHDLRAAERLVGAEDELDGNVERCSSSSPNTQVPRAACGRAASTSCEQCVRTAPRPARAGARRAWYERRRTRPGCSVQRALAEYVAMPCGPWRPVLGAGIARHEPPEARGRSSRKNALRAQRPGAPPPGMPSAVTGAHALGDGRSRVLSAHAAPAERRRRAARARDRARPGRRLELRDGVIAKRAPAVRVERVAQPRSRDRSSMIARRSSRCASSGAQVAPDDPACRARTRRVHRGRTRARRSVIAGSASFRRRRSATGRRSARTGGVSAAAKPCLISRRDRSMPPTLPPSAPRDIGGGP